MGVSKISELLYQYDSALRVLKEEPSAQQILIVLQIRDRLFYVLDDHPPISVGFQDQLAHLDHELKQQANLIIETTDLDLLRESIHPPEDAWWWFPENNLKPHIRDRYDWAWRSGTVVGWTANLALLTDITTKFISGGLGFGGAGAIILPSLITLIKARGDLTEVGQESLRNIFKKLGVKSHWQEEVTTLSTWVLTLIIFGFWSSLPQISKLYNYLGFQAETAGDISTAEANFKRAIALDEENIEAHYNLGSLYEEIRRPELAKNQYEIAAKASPEQGNEVVISAQNNLARLLILDESYSEAVVLLREGLADMENWEINNDLLLYTLNKNLGWARYKQGLHDQANHYLQMAASLNPENASAYCLQAQNYEAEEKEIRAIAAWKKCLNLVDPTEPDQDMWLVMAHKALDDSSSD